MIALLLLAIQPPAATRAFVVVQHGQVIHESYAPGVTPQTRQGTASLAKMLVGGISLSLAVHDGRLALDDPAWRYIPAWRDHPLKSKITIRHLATHTSGIEDAEEDHKPHDQLTGWKGAFWRRDPDPFTIAIHQAPVLFEPGTRYAYSNPGMAALAYAVTAALRGAPQSDIRALLAARVIQPAGIPNEEWSIGYGRAYEVDGLQLYANWGGGSFTPRAVARIGGFLLRRRDEPWVRTLTTYAGTPKPERRGGEPEPASALGCYTNSDRVWPSVPRDAYVGAGAGHQVLLVVPSIDLAAVRNGAVLKPEGFWRGAHEGLLAPLMKSLFPPPPSPVIRGVTFAPEPTIRRDAIDSDNWPITWADDGHLYTSYGDGWGFDPRTDRKLSQGFARLEGPGEGFRGVNVRSPTGERTGDGKAGAKASGMLMVDGVLYMWVRNLGNAQLAWSRDRGRTWEWGFRFDTSFGSPAFLNFGRNYQGARDEYVYTYSQDGPSAYDSDDHVVLARAPQGRLRDRAAWEFYAGPGPAWTRDIARRRPVFSLPGRCQRVDAVYNPGLRRYLLAVGYDHESGWGLYDAPEPWGPWTTAFHTEKWDLARTHGYRLPSKWISPDGRTMHLVFSGVRPWDAFCVRRMTLEAEMGTTQ
jgi:CubicO group peptidase (beta-lactamase class C family)